MELFELWLGEKEGIKRYASQVPIKNQPVSEVFVHAVLRESVPGFSPSLISRNEHGKPEIKGLPYSYNLSHCGPYYALVITSFPFCGIDIQEVKDPGKYKDALKSVFTDREYGLLSADGTDFDFFQLWSMKEAYVKALGGSIWYGRDFESGTVPGEYSGRWFKSGELYFYSMEALPGYSLSVAVPVKPRKLELRNFPLKDFS